MKAELTFSQELVDRITEKVISELRPLIAGSGSRGDDALLDVKGLSEYLKVSTKWIYERTQFNEIPHIKIKGALRFRKGAIDKWINSHNIPVPHTPEVSIRRLK